MTALKHQAGFTLFELIVAMALSALIALMGAAALSAGADFYQRARLILKEREDLRAAERILRTEWQARQPGVEASSGRDLEFGTDRPVFMAPLPGMVGRVGYRCDSTEAGFFRLVHVAWSQPPNEAAPGPGATPTRPAREILLEEVLLDRLRTCDLSLLQPAEGAGSVDAQPAQWVSTWRRELPPPKVLRLQAVGPRGDLPAMAFAAGVPGG